MFNIHFHSIGAYTLCGTGFDKKVEYTYNHIGFDDVLSRAQDLILNERFSTVDIVDANTGEVIATLDTDEYDEEDNCDSSFDFFAQFDEMGFNPYLGDYDYDC